MNITIKKPVSFSEKGGRLNNEDFVFPGNEQSSINNRLFLVCDGVGGSNKGEDASSIACDSIQTYFHTYLDSEKEFNPQIIEKSIRYAEILFDEHVRKHPDSKGMATTLCLLFFAHDAVYLTHAGNSRIYQFRNGKIIFKTEDHSMVNSLIKSGLLKLEDAATHPQKNVICRAIQGSFLPVEVDIVKITDVHPNDVFFMCTDGVTEVWSDNELGKLLSSRKSSEEKIDVIKEKCQDNAHDNYSGCLIPIHEVNKVNAIKHIFLYTFMY